MMYAIRIGKTAYDTQNENSANRYAVHSQVWNIDRNTGADNVICKINEMIYINGIVCDRRTLLTTLLRTIQRIFGTELTHDGCWVVAKIICLN